MFHLLLTAYLTEDAVVDEIVRRISFLFYEKERIVESLFINTCQWMIGFPFICEDIDICADGAIFEDVCELW